MLTFNKANMCMYLYNPETTETIIEVSILLQNKRIIKGMKEAKATNYTTAE